MTGLHPDSRIAGVCPVLAVPFDARGELDLPGFRAVVDHVLGTGVTAVTLFGLASEFHKLADDEREALLGALLDATRDVPGVAAIVSVTDHATHLAVRRARAAVAAGADAINLLPPHFLAPGGDAVAGHLRAVLASVEVPVVLQYAPAQTGTSLDAAAIAALAAEHDNLRIVKVESAPAGRLVSALAAGRPRIVSLVGQAGVQLADALRRGAAGVQPGCSFTELYRAVWDRYANGDQSGAVALHGRLLGYLAAWMQHVELIVQVEKTILARRGLIDRDHCRAPGFALDARDRHDIDRFLTEFAPLLEGTAA